MKKIVTIILVCLFCYANSQTVTSSCAAPDSIIKKYKRDADRLAIRKTITVNSTYVDSTKIDPVLSKRYLNALIAVYNATALPASDTVVNLLKIHRLFEDVNRIEFVADSNLSWMINYRNNVFPTGFSNFDNFITKYNFVKNSTYPYNNTLLGVMLQTDSSYNITRIADSLSIIPGISSFNYSYPLPYCPTCGFYLGMSRFITDTLNNNFVQLTYTYGWNDCPLGCIDQRHWTFKVYNDCSVEYLGSHGHALELQFVGIQEGNTSGNEIIIFPNPVKDWIKLVGKTMPKKISIMNVLGQTVVRIEKVEQDNLVDLSSLSSGVYFIMVEDSSSKNAFKIIKE